jgi:hypothetical protein
VQIEVFVDCAALSGYSGLLPAKGPPAEDCLTSITDDEQIAIIGFLQRELHTLKPGLGEVLGLVDQDSIETVRIAFPTLQSIKKTLPIAILVLLRIETDAMSRSPHMEGAADDIVLFGK